MTAGGGDGDAPREAAKRGRAETPPAAAGALPRRRLGGTGMDVSTLGFGCASLGGVYGDVDRAECRRTVHDAVRVHGINFFDTSPYYGNSEEVLGECLEGLDRGSYYVATKLGRYGDAPEDFDYSAARVRRSVAESLRRLRTGHIDLIQCHDIEFADLDQIVGETLPALSELRREGKVRWVGITSYVLEKLVYVLERARSGDVHCIQTYARLTLLDNTLLDLAPYLANKGVGVISGSPLAMGLLTGRPPPEWNSAPAPVKEAVARLGKVCEARGVPLPAVAMQYACGHAAAATTLMGTASRRRLQQNVDALSRPIAGDAYAAALGACMRELKGHPTSTRCVAGGAHNVICALNMDS